MREYLHTLYQFTDRWVVDDSKFRAAFGDLATPLDDALAATLEWYRDAATPTLESTEGHPMNMQHDPPPRRRTDGRRRRARHRRLHRPRLGLRLPADPRRSPPPTSSPPTGSTRARSPAGSSSWSSARRCSPRSASCSAASPAGRAAGGSPASASPPPPSRSSGCRAGCCSSRASATTPPCRPRPPTPTTPSNCCTPGSARSSARPIGYALTATFTVLVVLGVTRADRPALDGYLGYASAALIATGVVIPAGRRRRRAHQLRRLRRPGACGSSRWPSSSGAPGRDAAKDTDHKGSIWSDAKPSRG